MAYYPSSSYSSSPPLEVEIKISSAKDLKNINWRNGELRPYAVVWVDPKAKSSTKVDEYGDTCPTWDETITLPLPCPIDDETTLSIDIVHANASEGTKPLIGSTRVPLCDFNKGERIHRKLTLLRPSGRPQGKLEVDVTVRECRYRAPDAYYPPPYGVPPPPVGSRDYAYGGAPPPAPYYPYSTSGGPPAGYPYNPPQPYGQSPYGGQTAAYGGAPPVQGEFQQDGKKKGSKFGVGTGLAVGAVAGVLGGLALAEGADYVEGKIADDVAEKVENDLAYDDDDGGYRGDDGW